MKFSPPITMPLATCAVALAAIFGALKLWPFNTLSGWASTAVIVAAGFGLIVVVFVLGVWLRNRQRRRLTDMRDSALW